MDDNLWIRIENGQVVEGHHPAYESNIIDAFPELNGNLTTHFAPVDFTAAPSLNYGETVEGPFYEMVDGRVKVNYVVSIENGNTND
jgi:hypothetical protein